LNCMSDYEARIKTKFGELTVRFNDKADLEKKLEQIPELTATIERRVVRPATIEMLGQ